MGIVFPEKLRQPAPANVIGKNALFVGVRKPVFILQLFEKLDRHNVVVKPFKRCPDADVIVLNMKVRPKLRRNLRQQNVRRLFELSHRLRRGKLCSLLSFKCFFCLYDQGIKGFITKDGNDFVVVFTIDAVNLFLVNRIFKSKLLKIQVNLNVVLTVSGGTVNKGYSALVKVRFNRMACFWEVDVIEVQKSI